VGCGICVKGVEEGLMTLENNLARIDYHLYGKAGSLPTEKCPTKALILIEAVPEEETAVA
jgi:ferredoxin